MILLVNGEPLRSEKVLVTHGSSYHCRGYYIVMMFQTLAFLHPGLTLRWRSNDSLRRTITQEWLWREQLVTNIIRTWSPENATSWSLKIQEMIILLKLYNFSGSLRCLTLTYLAHSLFFFDNFLLLSFFFCLFVLFFCVFCIVCTCVAPNPLI